MPGPCLTNELVGVLIRFCMERVALTGDIRSMFHQIRVHPKDIDALRFLWWLSGDLDKDPVNCRMKVHLFGATSSPSCASFCLRQVVQDFSHLHSPLASEIVKNNFYVDDCLASFESEDMAINIVHDLVKLLNRGGFHLTKWTSNYSRVLQAIPKEERATQLQNYEIQSNTSQRVLGVNWNLEEDEFVFDVSLPKKPFTRRGLLSAVSSLFDPLGLVAPITLAPKLILQDLCRKKHDWDDHLDSTDVERWNCWLHDLSNLSRLRVTRCFKPNNFGRVTQYEIHLFSDASLRCYGSCCYLRMINSHGRIHCSFIVGKARVAPIKAVSIPKLKLTAAVVSVRLEQLVRKELCLINCESFFWTDATAVLQITKNASKRFPVFVANRIAIVGEHTSVDQWHFVPTKLKRQILPRVR